MDVSSGLRVLKEKEYLTDLSSSETLSNTIAKYYQNMQDVLMYEGKIVAYPDYFYPHAWAVNQNLWDKLALPALPKTYVEYIQLIDEWTKTHPEHQAYILMEQSTSRKTLMAEMIRSYILQNETSKALLTFDSPDFRTSAQAIFHMTDMTSEEFNANTFSDKPILLTQFPPPMGYDTSDLPSTLIMPPKVSKEDEPKVYAQLRVYVVNPNSPNKDLAILYLEYMAEHVNPVYAMQFDPVKNEPIVSDNQLQLAEAAQRKVEELKARLASANAEEVKELEQLLENAQTLYHHASEQALVSADAIARYRAIAPYITFGEQSVFLGHGNSLAYNSLLDAANRYLDGLQSLDQMISTMNQTSQIAYHEK